MTERKPHKHSWFYPHSIIDGGKHGDVAVVRYCGTCGTRQVGFIRRWKKAFGDYRRREHYGE